jgi:hypothetical protein
MQRRFHRITAHCGCHECVAEDVYRTTATSPRLDFGARPSYATGMSSASAGHDDYPDLVLDTTADVLSQLEDALESTQPSQPSQGGRQQQPPHCFTPGSSAVFQRKRDRHH